MKRIILTLALIINAMIMSAQGGAIDVHSHIITPGYLSTLARNNGLLDEGFPLPKWDADTLLAVMDRNGIGMAVLTMPAPQPYFGDERECIEAVRAINDESARLQAAHPTRIRFCAALPLPDVEASVAEVARAFDELGAVGVKLATNVRGQYLGDAALEPLMQALNERKATVIVHPHKPVPVNDSIIAAAPMAIYEYPAETTRAVVNMIAHGVTSRYPDIRWVIPHCGSFLPLAIERMKGVHPIMVRAGLMQPVDWATATANLYYDVAGRLTPDVLDAMLTVTGPEHILYGSDYPYVNEAGVSATKANVERVLAGNPQTAGRVGEIMSGNAKRIFGIE